LIPGDEKGGQAPQKKRKASKTKTKKGTIPKKKRKMPPKQPHVPAEVSEEQRGKALEYLKTLKVYNL